MKVNMNSNLLKLFSGTYGTFWEIYETDDNGNDLEVEFNFKNFMKSIIKAYQDKTKSILTDLKNATDNLITGIKFTNSFYNPRFYNFETDSIDFTLTINNKKLNQLLKDLKTNQKFETFLKDNYSSRDGFISFTPDTIDEIKKAIDNPNSDNFEQALAAIINYLVTKNKPELLNEIEQEVFDYWQANGYCGLDYKIINEEV
jgi:hypothetical protein